MATTVLLVDDHAVFRMGLKLLLANEGALQVVGEAGDGQAAIAGVQELSPDVVVMDIAMPDMDGIEATRHIRAEFPQTRIIALSIHGEKDFVEEMLRAGATGYVLKESAPEDLVPCIHAVGRGKVFLSASIKEVVVAQYMDGLAESEPPAGETVQDPILTSKLHHPRLTRNTVLRTRLIEQLEEGRDQPLTLMSAPAGYGKSTLVCQWLETCDLTSAWLSLDERDNDLRLFLTYLAAAIGNQFPKTLQDFSRLLKAPNLPPVAVLARTLINDLDLLPQRFILVLDDYHRIEEPSIHELLGELLRYPSHKLHMVLASRTDPSLDLLQLRAYQRMGEVRAQGLSFTVEDTMAYLEKVLGTSVEGRIAREITEKTEGWVTGLHLITLSVHDSAGLANLSTILPGEQQTLDYLAAETLSRQPRDVQAWLLKTSILDRYCASLCEAVCASAENGEPSYFDGDEFIRWLTENNLFVIELDQQGHWFRYHHLFQELLQNQLESALDAQEITDLYSRASRWLLENGLIEEAIKYALAAGDALGAAEIIEKHRHIVLAKGHWQAVDRWLAMLPATIRQERPELILTEVWIAFMCFQLAQIPPMIEKAETLLGDQSVDPYLLGELNFFHGNILYWNGKPEASARTLEEALSQIAGKEEYVDGNIELMLGLARHMNGQGKFAIEALRERIRTTDPSELFLRSYLFSTLVFLHVLSGELILARTQVLRLHKENKNLNNLNNQAWAFYLQAYVNLQTYDLEGAIDPFVFTTQQRYFVDTGALIDALAGLALTQQLMRQQDDAAQTLNRLLELTQELNEPQFLSVAHSCQARISLLRGNLVQAVKWARADIPAPVPAELFLWLEVPAITRARVLIADGSEDSLEKATELLWQIREQCEAHFFTNQTIEVVVLQSLALEKSGRSGEAMDALAEALILAAPGGWVRPFVELGAPMAGLLSQLHSQGVVSDYISQILAALAETKAFAGGEAEANVQLLGSSIDTPYPLGASLTKREQQVLLLLATTLSPEEIADELTVSVATVRTHTKRIYNKLDAHTRLDAVATARDLGLL